jgi:predicted dienelactone hydrolase
MLRLLTLMLLCLLLAVPGATPVVAANGAPYSPMTTPYTVTTVEEQVWDGKRNRRIPLLIYLPKTQSSRPVILFSHGLGGTRYGSSYLGKHWAGHGYVAVFLQHPGSDDQVWQSVPAQKRQGALESAVSGQNFLLRVKDVPAVLDQLQRWNGQPDHPLFHRLDLAHVGMSGHSFGAVTTQAVSGQRFPGVGTQFTDRRIRSAVIFSPSSRRKGGRPSDAFGSVQIPWLLMTGTEDIASIGNIDMAARLAVYLALPPGRKYELVLAGGQHSTFTDRPLPSDRAPRNPQHHPRILAISTAFWDATLTQNPQAQAWLDGPGPRSILDPADRWQMK